MMLLKKLIETMDGGIADRLKSKGGAVITKETHEVPVEEPDEEDLKQHALEALAEKGKGEEPEIEIIDGPEEEDEEEEIPDHLPPAMKALLEAKLAKKRGK